MARTARHAVYAGFAAAGMAALTLAPARAEAPVSDEAMQTLADTLSHSVVVTEICVDDNSCTYGSGVVISERGDLALTTHQTLTGRTIGIIAHSGTGTDRRNTRMKADVIGMAGDFTLARLQPANLAAAGLKPLALGSTGLQAIIPSVGQAQPGANATVDAGASIYYAGYPDDAAEKISVSPGVISAYSLPYWGHSTGTTYIRQACQIITGNRDPVAPGESGGAVIRLQTGPTGEAQPVLAGIISSAQTQDARNGDKVMIIPAELIYRAYTQLTTGKTSAIQPPYGYAASALPADCAAAKKPVVAKQPMAAPAPQ